MQPFVTRPAARAVWRHGRIGLELAARLPGGGRTSGAVSATARWPTMISTACLRCHNEAIAYPARFYSSQPPLNNSDKPSRPPQPPPKVDNATGSASAKSTAETTAPSSRPSWLELPSMTESRRSVINKGFTSLMDNVQSKVLNASVKLNEITGYTGIEAIKVENETLEASLAEAQARVRSARLAYKTSNTKRANTQREVTTLLARKDSWSPSDLERFTELYRTDHVLEGEVVAAQENLTESESDEQKLSQKLSAGILKRYHEEQIWSDRIRRASTWGTWGLMGMNFVLFVVLQFVAEPWKRKRLVNGVVAEEKRALEDVRLELAAVKEALDKMTAAAEEAGVSPSRLSRMERLKQTWKFTTSGAWIGTFNEWKELATDREKWRPALEDLVSERKLEMRMRDASILVVEGLLTGIAISWGFGSLFGRR